MTQRLCKQKMVQRSAYSGKILNGRPAICVTEAVEFVKKMGYSVESLIWTKLKTPYEVINNEKD